MNLLYSTDKKTIKVFYLQIQLSGLLLLVDVFLMFCVVFVIYTYTIHFLTLYFTLFNYGFKKE